MEKDKGAFRLPSVHADLCNLTSELLLPSGTTRPEAVAQKNGGERGGTFSSTNPALRGFALQEHAVICCFAFRPIPTIRVCGIWCVWEGRSTASVINDRGYNDFALFAGSDHALLLTETRDAVPAMHQPGPMELLLPYG